ncbi:MAG: sucrose-6-phosphate hydrolase [Erysipelotrichia bacterium]|nr:sucrose-6-phosphate hydrolase [Erysipelotrichia bacterium]NCC54066.1 sucrose-6-phosphate hydrolase [Erysipelotrichia bacterium]
MFEKYKKINRRDFNEWYSQQKEEINKVSQDPYRLQYHLMADMGWLNDPNGLCQFQGVYHIYYQYCPFNTEGSLKLWGHYSTRDFIHYKKEEVALFPDEEIDAHGVYSGSAYIEDDQIHYFYTGNVKYFDRPDYDYINAGRGSNTIYFNSKDGVHFSKKELLMTTNEYPDDVSNHVRDPKIIKRNHKYYMVLGARDKKDCGCVLLYESEDMKDWHYYNRIQTEKQFGYMWECPDLFEINGQLVLTCCPQGVAQDGLNYENVHQSVWMFIDYDFEHNTYKINKIHQMDRGFDFYVQQSFTDEEDRQIMIGWLGLPDIEYSNPTIEKGWQHALTIPRQLSIKNDMLVQQPIPQLKKLRKETYEFNQETLNAAHRDDEVYELALMFKNDCEFTLSLNDEMCLVHKQGILTLDITKCGSGRTTRKVAITSLNNMRIFSDISSLEIFVNDGEEVFTTRVYPTKKRDIQCIGEEIEARIMFYTLKGFSFVEDQNEK